MKKLTILLAIVLIGLNAFAQKPTLVTDQNPAKKSVAAPKFELNQKLGGEFFGAESRELDCDTTAWINWLPCDTPYYYYYIDQAPFDSGYISGHNAYLDKAKAEYYADGVPGDSIKGVLCWFAFADASNSTPKITITIWDDDGTDGAPGTVLATKQISILSIENNIADETTAGFVETYFNTPIPNPDGGFYAGFQMTYSGGVWNPAGPQVASVNPDFAGCDDYYDGNTAWEKWSDNSWHQYIDVYGVGFKNAYWPITCAPPAGCTISASANPSTICKNKTTELTATGTATTFAWAPANLLESTTTATVTTLKLKTVGTTTFTVTGDNGACSATVDVVVNAIPTGVNVSQAACSGGAILLTANGNPTTGVKYKWFRNGTAISGATAKTYSATLDGNYKAKITITATGCAKTSAEVAVDVNCKDGEFIGGMNIEAYPNPFVNTFSVSMNSASTEEAFITLSDYSGRVIREYRNIDPSMPFEIKENLSAGVYFLNVTQGTETKMIKVVKND